MRDLDSDFLAGAEKRHGLARLISLVSFKSAGLRWTDFRSDVTFDGKAYSAKGIAIDDELETLDPVSPDATLRVTSLDATEQARFDANELRGDRVTLRRLWWSGTALADTGLVSYWRVDTTACAADAVELRLAAMDAVQGSSVPRYTTAASGCQWEFRRGGCWYRPPLVEGRPYPSGTSFAHYTSCDRTLDGPNGCKRHFEDIGDLRGVPWTLAPGGTRRVLPKPYNAFPGGIRRVF